HFHPAMAKPEMDIQATASPLPASPVVTTTAPPGFLDGLASHIPCEYSWACPFVLARCSGNS
ncbi:UNVERIFIED_CONTAM: hypothetical protein H355_006219, partial [Colinus virginianus]